VHPEERTGVNVELRHILFPVDFSENCTAVADDVEAIVRRNGAQLTLLHVLEYPPSWYGDIDAPYLASTVDFAVIKESRQEQLNRYLDRRFHHVGPLRLLSQGDAATGIVQYAPARNSAGTMGAPENPRGLYSTPLHRVRKCRTGITQGRS
jgi:nucleotide-binding universal stress UspA family protein